MTSDLRLELWPKNWDLMCDVILETRLVTKGLMVDLDSFWKTWDLTWTCDLRLETWIVTKGLMADLDSFWKTSDLTWSPSEKLPTWLGPDSNDLWASLLQPHTQSVSDGYPLHCQQMCLCWCVSNDLRLYPGGQYITIASVHYHR